MKKKFSRVLAGFTAAVLAVGSIFCCTPAVSSAAEPSRVSVHDPSIVKSNEGTYYVFGSHMADAKSSDLINWTQMNNDWNARSTKDAWKNDSVFGDVVNNLSESFRWAGYNDGDCSGGGLAVWAPDVIYNSYYKWEDGSTGAYMIYYSASSTWRRSCIGYAVSKNVEGPYKYVDTVVYSGFTKNGKTDGRSTRNTKWDNDYLNLKKLIDSKTISGISDKWFTSDGGWNHTYGPNAIDPTLFFDKTGKSLYMVYGSWSGGLYILEIDPVTGEAIYPGTDSTDKTSGNYVDRYFGTHIAGGDHASGEGPFILYDAETDYYYLYETYGGLTANGGYNMRLFRSKNVYGPYTDANGRNSAKNSSYSNRYGIKLIGNYSFSNEGNGYRAAGHNSALINDDGSHYLIYHQRFNQPGFQSEYHEVRVHQQFMNEDGWPVTAVYEYTGEKIGHYSQSEVVGTYDFVNHGTSTDGNMIYSDRLVLLANGKVAGDMTGTWTKSTGKDKSYDYITIKSGSTTYKGVLFKQKNEAASPSTVMTFTVTGNNNECIWGTKVSKSTSLRKFVKLKDPVLKVTAKKKSAVLTWKKVKDSAKIKDATGYEIQYGLKKNMKGARKITIKKGSTVKKTIKKLKSGKKYYFRMRAYAGIDGKKVYSDYSYKKKAVIK